MRLSKGKGKDLNHLMLETKPSHLRLSRMLYFIKKHFFLTIKKITIQFGSAFYY